MQNFLNLKLSRSRDSLVSQRKFNELSKNLNLTDTLIEQRNRFEMNKTSQRKKLDFYISQSCYAAKLWWYFIQSDGIFLQSYWTCKICKVFKKKRKDANLIADRSAKSTDFSNSIYKYYIKTLIQSTYLSLNPEWSI